MPHDPLSTPSPEFPEDHLETPPSEESLYVSRRGLLGSMASTLALLGAEGCRRPVEKIVPYARMPEDVIPGIPLHYATLIQRRGESLSLLVESHEGRPTKVEGNDRSITSFGAADHVAQATILELYDPERSTAPRRAGKQATWADFDTELAGKLAGFDPDQGARLRILMPPTLSPTVLRMRAALAQRFPKARVHTWSAVSDSNAREGARIAFGQPVYPWIAYDKARVVVSLDSDFLQTESGNVRAGRLFAQARRLRSSIFPMNRLYVVEPALTTTGATADHRLPLPASHVEGYAYALGQELLKNAVGLSEVRSALDRQAKQPNGEAIPARWIGAVAKDLIANRGHAVVVVGSRQPARLHALAHAMNAALGAVGPVIYHMAVADPDELDVVADMQALSKAVADGQVDALVILGGNPAYDAPADTAFGDKIARVPFTVHASLFVDETSQKCTWHVPLAHEFEAWGDGLSLEHSVNLRQPLILPLYGGRSEIELLAQVANAPERTGYDAVRATSRAALLADRGLTACAPGAGGAGECRDASGAVVPFPEVALEHDWRQGLSVGTLKRSKAIEGLSPRVGAIAAAIDGRPAPVRVGPDSPEVTFAPCPKMVDGRHANNTWLQEMPNPITRLSWDNAAVVSRDMAASLGIANGDRLTIRAGQRSIEAAAWIVPGQATHSIALTLGWGRRGAGRIGNERGFDAYPLRTTDALGFAVGARVTRAEGEPYVFARTQEHDSTEGRPIAPQATLARYKEAPNFAEIDSPPQRSLPLWSQQDYSQGHQWGMTVDLTSCTGCGACVIACMAENNVPVVGKTEVWRGRAMHWLRVDRYYVDDAKLGATAESPLVVHQPVMCVHCEEAPCENVCPVNATVHGPEGLNEMVYNRCIGTRYCANNCPYKVRRFNYLNWHNDAVWKETGGLPETLQMQQNPNVTVRFRGVMEKCTYCVQRIQAAKIAAKRENREVKDGEIKTACQQTCPSEAIVFGDINDKSTLVWKYARTDRRFALLGELGTRPRTMHLGKVRNPNPEML